MKERYKVGSKIYFSKKLAVKAAIRTGKTIVVTQHTNPKFVSRSLQQIKLDIL